LIICMLLVRCAPAQVLQNDSLNSQDRQKDFIAYNPDYLQQKDIWTSKIKALGIQLYRKELAGEHTTCAYQLFSEMTWLLTSTADFKRIDVQYNELEELLKSPPNKNDTLSECYEEWFFRLKAHGEDLKKKKKYAYLLDTINSPEKLTAYLRPLSKSDIARTGIDNSRELNESLSILMRLILRDKPKGYQYDPQLKDTLMKVILTDLRNPETGFWGEHYVRNGKIVFVDDISHTFHVISYLDGNVPGMDKILKTTLAIKNYDATAGWLYKGKYWNHTNVDVVEILRYCWPYANARQKQEISMEMEKMLHWCLIESLQPDGSFKPLAADGSMEECMYYGESYLSRLGFFDPAKCFWTDRKFPEAEGIRQNIIAFIKKHQGGGAAGGDYYRSALEELEGKD